MKSANFDVQFLNEYNLDNIENIVDENGVDKIEFLFSANLGVELRPLNKIISGGEIKSASLYTEADKFVKSLKVEDDYIYDEKTKQKMKADRIYWVTGEDELCEELKMLLGEKNVALKY